EIEIEHNRRERLKMFVLAIVACFALVQGSVI
ncbi:hypothetical protein X975_24006, partial [Stegodyphus mimosarum]